MRVALLCGSCPEGMCGVGDYTVRLAASLNTIGIEAYVINTGNWRLRDVFNSDRLLHTLKPDIVHIQYPTQGFGSKLGPQGESLLRSCVVTLHEVSQARLLRKIALLPFSIRPKHIIFTTEYERQFALHWTPWLSRQNSVIPIPSNIKEALPGSARSVNEIVYFGLVMPRKGIEDVIKLAKLVYSTDSAIRVRIVGTPPSKHTRYFEYLRSSTTTLPILWDCGLNEEQVAQRLASCSVAYLPYPDGVSERRTSLKAALINRVAVITTRGPQTPIDLDTVVRFCETPEQALAAAIVLLENPTERCELADRGLVYAKQFSWQRIAALHSAIYEQLLFQPGRIISSKNSKQGLVAATESPERFSTDMPSPRRSGTFAIRGPSPDGR
jgi:glycosyltransferase involved in cell wall biosynthesis